MIEAVPEERSFWCIFGFLEKCIKSNQMYNIKFEVKIQQRSLPIMLKKLRIVLMAFMLITVLGTQASAETTGVDGHTGTNTNTYQGTHTNTYRTTATDGAYRGNNWGWIGLLGLVGLAGLRGRNQNPGPNRR
jgi:hypothetical protein